MNAPLRISELADILHARADPKKGMALLRAYFDESGLHQRPIVTGVACFLAYAPVWDLIEQEWSDVLARIQRDLSPAIRVFHAYACEHGAEEWQGIPRPIREAFYRRFVAILCGHEALFGVSAMVVMEDWDRYTTPGFRERVTPYQMCAEHCFRQVGYWSGLEPGPPPVALVFAEHQKFSPRASEIFSHYMAAKPWAHFRSLTFGSPADYLPLQCADLLAYESYIHWLRVETEGLGFGTDRPCMDRLLYSSQMRVDANVCFCGHDLADAVRRLGPR